MKTISSVKRIPIAIVGLENAGKTSLTHRLQTGKFKQTQIPTRGLDIETVEVKEQLFQLFDLGGHIKFREMFWKMYVQLSQGIIFIIDSSDPKRIEETSEWFWKCLEWNSQAPLLILANKTDLDHMELGELMDKIKLAELPQQNPNRPFRIFDTSIKKGTNVDEALEWFFLKVHQTIEKKKVELIGIYLYLPTGLLVTSHQFKKFEGEDLDVDMIPGFLLAIDQFASGVMGPNNSLQSINTESADILLVKREGVLCAIVSGRGSDATTTRMIAESFLTYVEINFSDKITLFQRDGKLIFPKDFIVNYIQHEFANNLVIETA
jgi:small GTP-binding protein